MRTTENVYALLPQKKMAAQSCIPALRWAGRGPFSLLQEFEPQIVKKLRDFGRRGQRDRQRMLDFECGFADLNRDPQSIWTDIVVAAFGCESDASRPGNTRTTSGRSQTGRGP